MPPHPIINHSLNLSFIHSVVFVDVHFMLFYTAVFNAIQSVLVRFLSVRRTDKAWVQTEDIDIGHYVAIRKEFDRLDHELQKNDEDNDRSFLHRAPSIRTWFHDSMNDIAMKLRHPHLARRRHELLVPLRFHELRAHFIDSNNLPPKFKVSHYLKRSLNSVLLAFVDISSSAWILLMATGNLMYFLSGMILSVSKSKYSVAEFLVIVFFVMCALFVVFVFGIFFKMRWVFSKMLK